MAVAQALVLPNRPIGRILALDPGVRDVGLARVERGALTGAWWVRATAAAARCKRCSKACDHASAPLQRAAMVDEAWRVAGDPDAYDLLIVEWPVIYRGGRGAPADDVLDLAGVAAGFCALANGCRTSSWQVRPREWKGDERKDIFQMYILASLAPSELALVPRGAVHGRYASDAVDAVGLALWAAGRLGTLVASPARFESLVEPPRERGRRGAPSKKQQALPFNPRGRR